MVVDPHRETFLSPAAPYLEWPKFIERFEWRQGEHVSLIGPTGFGKTTTVGHLLDHPPIGKFVPQSQHWFWKRRGKKGPEYPEIPRPYSVILATKPKDEVVDRLKGRGFIVMREWRGVTPDFNPDVYPRRILWPRALGLGAAPAQRMVIRDALGKIFAEGGWTVNINELIYTTDRELMGLFAQYRDFLIRARSMGITVVSELQRPAHVPREAYSQVRHLFFWNTRDSEDLKSIQGIGGLDGKEVREIVMQLEMFEVLYVNTLKREMYRTKAPSFDSRI